MQRTVNTHFSPDYSRGPDGLTANILTSALPNGAFSVRRARGRAAPGDGREVRRGAWRRRSAGARRDAGGAAAPVRSRAAAGQGVRRPLAADRPRTDDLAALGRRFDDPAPGGRGGTEGPRDRHRVRVPGGGALTARPHGLFAGEDRRARAGGLDDPSRARLPERLRQGVRRIPETLLEQLAVGGRLVAPVGPADRQRIRVVRRRKTDFAREDGEEVVFVPLLGKFGRKPA